MRIFFLENFPLVSNEKAASPPMRNDKTDIPQTPFTSSSDHAVSSDIKRATMSIHKVIAASRRAGAFRGFNELRARPPLYL